MGVRNPSTVFQVSDIIMFAKAQYEVNVEDIETT